MLGRPIRHFSWRERKETMSLRINRRRQDDRPPQVVICYAANWNRKKADGWTHIQGGPSGRGQHFVDYEIRVALLYTEFIF